MRKCSIACLFFGFLLILAGCTGKADLRPKRDCKVEGLLLGQSDYPSGTQLNVINSPVGDKPQESADQSANYKGSVLFQEIVRFFSSENAIAEYKNQKELIFTRMDVLSPWESPPMLDLGNLSANQHKIACGDLVSFGKRCYMIGQYQEYYFLFTSDISTGGVTRELFRDLVLRIDSKMAACLSH